MSRKVACNRNKDMCELLAIFFIRYRFTGGKLANAIVQVVIGGGIVFTIGAWFGRIGVS